MSESDRSSVIDIVHAAEQLPYGDGSKQAWMRRELFTLYLRASSHPGLSIYK